MNFYARADVNMIQLAIIHIICLNLLIQAVPLTINCEDGNTAKEVENCFHPFKEYYDAGVIVLTQVNSSTVDYICSQYDKARSCLVMYMSFCPDIKKRLTSGVNSFEYACTADRTGEWPYSPTINPEYEIDLETEKKNAQYYGDLVKISIAAGATFLLVVACAVADTVTKCKVKGRVKKATAAAISHADHEELLKKSTEEKLSRV